MNRKPQTSQSLAAAITRSASKQTYYTILLLVDRPRVGDAYRAYGYFRWVDDVIDSSTGLLPEKAAFLQRQQFILESCYHDVIPVDLCPEERMLADLILHDAEPDSGVRTYLCNMMEVIVFDLSRRGRLISQSELSEYTRKLATAVTEAMYYFIGHNHQLPRNEDRYLAVTAAHITHMLRDTLEDIDNGYYNIPLEVLNQNGISPRDVNSPAYQEWIGARVKLARRYFRAGREYIAQERNIRCRLAGYAYIARFERILRVIENEN